MRISKIILTIAAFTSFAASAAEPNCGAYRSPTSPLNDVVRAANVTADTDSFGNIDGRGSLTEKTGDITNAASGAVFTPDEAAQIRKSTGYVVCPGTKYKNPAVASAALVGSNMQLITSVHTFIDKSGKKREPLSECYFYTQDGTDQKLYFDFESGNFRFGKEGPRKDGDPNDYAVVQLKKPIEGATAFQVDGTELQADEWVAGIAAGQKAATRTFPKDDPVAQQCRVRGLQHPEFAPVQYITDCDLSPIGSGGVVFTRNSSGALLVRGIFTTTGTEKLNGEPFNPATGSFTRVVSVTNNLADDIEEVKSSLPKNSNGLIY